MKSGDSAGEKSTSLWPVPLGMPSIIHPSKLFASEQKRMMQTRCSTTFLIFHLAGIQP
jgi:hypothetical protein